MKAVLDSSDELLQNERKLHLEGFGFIAGVDEAGRGPLAGPVVAAAVILPQLETLPGVFDSKQLTDKRRRELRDEIRAVAEVGVGIVDAGEIDQINILKATHKAMHLAVAALKKVDFVLVDGLPVPGFSVACRNIVKGDALCASIAAASIIAKVTRDELMEEFDSLYPGYGFARHKGYGTAAHLDALRKMGASPIHRRTFAPVRRIIDGEDVQQELFE